MYEDLNDFIKKPSFLKYLKTSIVFTCINTRENIDKRLNKNKESNLLHEQAPKSS